MKDVKHDNKYPSTTNNKLIESLIFGSLSSTFTTIIYQPLELLKTKIQLRQQNDANRIIGRSTQSAKELIKLNGLGYLWRGSAASLLRSVPGVGLYYASLNFLQSNFSQSSHIPNNSYQAFYFALTARSIVSFVLSPVTVVKVRYESGRYNYASLQSAIRDAYFKNGWVGVVPTIIRDSLFSGVYYMCYTQLKLNKQNVTVNCYEDSKEKKIDHFSNFKFGIISGIIASIVTNPLDVLKTVIQVDDSPTKNRSVYQNYKLIIKEHGYARFYDGLGPRCLRRTLIAASTWTFYEFFMNTLK